MSNSQEKTPQKKEDNIEPSPAKTVTTATTENASNIFGMKKDSISIFNKAAQDIRQAGGKISPQKKSQSSTFNFNSNLKIDAQNLFNKKIDFTKGSIFNPTKTSKPSENPFTKIFSNSSNIFASKDEQNKEEQQDDDTAGQQQKEDPQGQGDGYRKVDVMKDEYSKNMKQQPSPYFKLYTMAIEKFTVDDQNKGQGMMSFQVIKDNDDDDAKKQDQEQKVTTNDKAKSAIIVLRNSIGKLLFQGIFMRPLTRISRNDEKAGKIRSNLMIPIKKPDGGMKLAKAVLKFKFEWNRTEFEESFKTVLKMLPKPQKKK